ncbi:hypothetical protein MRB53_041754 [Persea americana]|nr:hypothetical protein MRB53_041754 [Persea americana]
MLSYSFAVALTKPAQLDEDGSEIVRDLITTYDLGPLSSDGWCSKHVAPQDKNRVESCYAWVPRIRLNSFESAFTPATYCCDKDPSTMPKGDVAVRPTLGSGPYMVECPRRYDAWAMDTVRREPAWMSYFLHFMGTHRNVKIICTPA